jgi:DNA-binding NarL/FixJ family response regulator
MDPGGGARQTWDVAAETVRVLLCDDHAMIRDGLKTLLQGREGIEVVASTGDGPEALEAAVRHEPDVVLMDLALPTGSGAAATRRILSRVPGTKVVVLTSFADPSRVVDAIDAGATGVVFKDSGTDVLVRAIRSAARGEAPLDPRAARALMTDRPAAAPPLTDREAEVLRLVGEGLQNKAIARELGITETTVKAHLTRIYRQIGVEGRTQAALWARRHRLAGR